MKILSYISLILALAAGTSCSQETDSKSGEITIKGSATHDFRTIEYNGNGTHDFIFKNTGKSTLIITNVVSSCGCTVPVYPREPIEKGDVDTIRVKYNTRKVGTFSKSVTVHSTGEDSPMVLRIKGEVLPPDTNEN